VSTLVSSMRAFVLALALIAAAADAAAAQTCGDADRSGSVTLSDGVSVLRAAAGLPSPCADDPSRCDVDASGSATVSDGVNVLRHAAGLPVTLSCPAAGVARFAGRYQGTFSGDDQGDFDVEVGCDGDIEGFGHSDFFDEDFDIDGSVTRDGDLTLTAGDTSSLSEFRGTLGEDGRVSGTWHNDFEGTDGSFQGSRASSRSCP